MKLLKAIIPIIVVVILSFWAFKPILIPGFFPIHDDTQVARVYEMTKSLDDGMFPVRWVSDLGYGYGYPIFNFYAPLAYYVGSIFMFLGINALDATKLMMGMGIIFSGIFMYILGKEFWGKLGGIVSAVFYLYAPYHAVDIYVRGDVAEFWAYAFIPLAFLGIYKVSKSKGGFSWVIVGALSYAGIILSHNLTAMMISPFLAFFALILIYCAYRKKEKHTIYSLLISLGLGLALSAFYFLPALQEQRFTNVLSQIGGGADFRDHFVCPLQLWQSQWGFGGSTSGCFDGISFMIGKIHLLAAVVVLLIATVLKFKKRIEKNSIQLKIIILSLFWLFASIFIMLPVSEVVWKSISVMAFLQYPWRFLIIASFFTSLLAGSIVFLLKLIFNNKYLEYLTFAFLILLVIIVSLKFFAPQTIFGKNSSDYTNIETLKWTTSKISDEYMPRDFPKPTNSNDVVMDTVSFNSQDIKINSRFQNTKDIMLNLDVLKQTSLHFNIAYFPSWKLTVDGNDKGSIVSKGYEVELDRGSHIVEMKFAQSPVEIFSNFISIAGFLALIFGIILEKKKTIYG